MKRKMQPVRTQKRRGEIEMGGGGSGGGGGEGEGSGSSEKAIGRSSIENGER
jgi:hypothetical protein